MSKAFTRESDDADDRPLPSRPIPTLPAGAKNYFTETGAEQFRAELERLLQLERPAVAASGEGSETKRQLQIIDQRISQMQQSLESAIVVPRPPPPWDQVKFGATVTVQEASGLQEHYRIVGIDEADSDRDWVSWCSPIARALLNGRLGQRVRLRVPAGERELEIVGITYHQREKAR